MKGYGYVLIVVLGLVFGLFLLAYRYGSAVGKRECERVYAEQQSEIIKESEQKENAVKKTVNSADIDNIRRLLCENARGGCNTKRSDN